MTRHPYRRHTFGPEANTSIVTDEPDLPEIRREIQCAIDDAFDFYDRSEHALEVRYCQWDGQTADGRKWGTAGKAAFPWPGASDARIRTVDMVILEQVDMLTTALSRMNIQAVPVEARDADWAGRMSALLRWYLKNEMADEGGCETELLANYMLTYGSSVLGIGWHQELTYDLQRLTLTDLQAMAEQTGDPNMLASVSTMLFDPLAEPVAIEQITRANQMLTQRDARRILQNLREAGVAEFPKPRIREARPRLRALQTFQDVFFPARTKRLQGARWIAERELLTEAELREKAEGREEWDEDFVKEVLDKHEGSTFNQTPTALNVSERQRELGGVWGARAESDKTYEVWHFFVRATHRGIPALFQTTLHPACEKYWAKHKMLDYAHGEYPHVEFVRERTMPSILASRGWPEVLDSEQDAIKTEYDGRRDRSAVTTLPPIKEQYKAGSPARAFGPGIRIPVHKMTDVEVMTWGAPDPTSVEVERNTRRNVAEYAGIAHPEVDPQRTQARQQAMVNRWLGRHECAMWQVLSLAQQFTPTMKIAKIAGRIPKDYEITAESIAGGFDLLLTFNTQFLNPEYAFKFMKFMTESVLPIDTDAVIIRGEVVRYGLEMWDPTLGDRCVRPQESADQSEIDDEQRALGLIYTGQDAPMKLKGQNHKLRLTVFQNVLADPELQAEIARRPKMQERLQGRLDFLAAQVQQLENAQIGRFGTKPSAGSDGTGAGLGSFAGGGL